MRLLHCADIHLGKTLRGHSRLPEHEAVLAEIEGIAIAEGVDCVLVAGDVFDAAHPPTDAVRIWYDWLNRLATHGIDIVVIGGNHDNQEGMQGTAGIMRWAGIHVVGAIPERLEDCRVVVKDATIVCVPWIKERAVIGWETLSERPGMVMEAYSANVGAMLQAADTLFAGAKGARIAMFHGYVAGSALSEGSAERGYQTTRGFAVRPIDLPSQASYVALGHLHLPQQVASHVPAYYSGSPLQLDFGEGGQDKSVRLIEVDGENVRTWTVPLTTGRLCRTIEFGVDDLDYAAEGLTRPLSDDYGDDWLRARVHIPGPDPYLYQKVTAVLPNAVAVEPVYPERPDRERVVVETPVMKPHTEMDPGAMFARYLETQDLDPEMIPALMGLFKTLYEAEGEAAKPKDQERRKWVSHNFGVDCPKCGGQCPYEPTVAPERWPVILWPVPAGIEPYSPEHRAWSEATYTPYDLGR